MKQTSGEIHLDGSDIVRYPDKMRKQSSNKRLSTFSCGMKQRVGMACVMLGNPQSVIVDEPTAGLDPQERITVRNLLSEYARMYIVILSTLVISDIEAVASRLLI